MFTETRNWIKGGETPSWLAITFGIAMVCLVVGLFLTILQFWQDQQDEAYCEAIGVHPIPGLRGSCRPPLDYLE